MQSLESEGMQAIVYHISKAMSICTRLTCGVGHPVVTREGVQSKQHLWSQRVSVR